MLYVWCSDVLQTFGILQNSEILKSFTNTANFHLSVVPFRETIIEPPETDMVNEELNEENKILNTNDKQVRTSQISDKKKDSNKYNCCSLSMIRVAYFT